MTSTEPGFAATLILSARASPSLAATLILSARASRRSASACTACSTHQLAPWFADHAALGSAEQLDELLDADEFEATARSCAD